MTLADRYLLTFVSCKVLLTLISEFEGYAKNSTYRFVKAWFGEWFCITGFQSQALKPTIVISLNNFIS